MPCRKGENSKNCVLCYEHTLIGCALDINEPHPRIPGKMPRYASGKEILEIGKTYPIRKKGKMAGPIKAFRMCGIEYQIKPAERGIS